MVCLSGKLDCGVLSDEIKQCDAFLFCFRIMTSFVLIVGRFDFRLICQVFRIPSCFLSVCLFDIFRKLLKIVF